MRNEDCISLIHLMNNGFTMKDACALIEEERNQIVIVQINQRLNQGEKLSEFFTEYCPKEYRGYFSGFILYMPFADALEASYQIVEKENKQKEEIIRGMLYPTILFIGMLAGIYMFNALILPSMISLMSGFGLADTVYVWMQRIISILSLLLLISTGSVSILILYALGKKQIAHTYQMLYRRFPNSLLVQYASSEFVRFYLECVKRNISTIETMKILKQFKQKPLTAYLANELDQSLLSGKDMETAIAESEVERTLVRFFKIAIYASDTAGMMEGYLQMVRIRTMASIKRFSIMIQMISYSAIGLVLIFVYKVLMMPMCILQNI